jgi:choice-of-anchor A domain-containing protein
MRNGLVLALLGMVAIVYANPARAGNLGIANSYTEFSFGSSYRYGDSTGRVAVGGDATFSNFTIGSSVGGSGNALVVGGNLGGSQSNVNGGGNASYHSTSNGTHVYFNDGGSGVTQPSTINFSAAETYLKSLSTTLEATSVNGATSANGQGELTLSGASSTLDVFTVTQAQLTRAQNQGVIFSVPSSATVVVNIAGATDSLQNFSFFLNGLSETHILYDFYQATSLNITNIAVEGSVLAPLADINFFGGQINGTLIGNEINSNANTWGSGESHYDLFAGNLPDPSDPPDPPAVPEPSSMVMMLTAGAVGLISLARRRMRRTA